MRGERAAVFIARRVERDRRMALLPAMCIAGEIARDGVKPRRKFSPRIVTGARFIHAHESLLREVERRRLISAKAREVTDERLLPARHEFIESEVIAPAQPSHRRGVGFVGSSLHQRCVAVSCRRLPGKVRSAIIVL